MNAGIDVAHLTKTFGRGKPPALIDLNLRVEPGETLGIVGPNGAGKTTFLGCLLGLLVPTRGTIRVDGMAPDSLRLRREVGYLPERLQFDRWMTGRQFLTFHHALAGRPPATRAEEVAALLGRVDLERGSWDRRLKTYSRGMLQRLGLAQTLVGDPRFVFLDEPTSGVDPPGVLKFQEIASELKARGVTIIVNSHQLEQLERVCDRVAFIDAGEVQAIEDLRGAAVGPSMVVVRWVADGAPPAERLTALAAQAEVRLVEQSADRGHFAVLGDAQTARLVRILVEAGFAVVEVAPEGGRLGKFFRTGATS
jgi:ABC-2 type transport system ATP-binding protein